MENVHTDVRGERLMVVLRFPHNYSFFVLFCFVLFFPLSIVIKCYNVTHNGKYNTK